MQDDVTVPRLKIVSLKGWKISNILKKNKELKFYSGRVKSRLKSGNVCYQSMLNLLSYSLPTKNIKVKIYRTIILTVVCMDVKHGRSQ